MKVGNVTVGILVKQRADTCELELNKRDDFQFRRRALTPFSEKWHYEKPNFRRVQL